MTIYKQEGLFSALYYLNYRYLCLSTLGTATVVAVEQVVLGWFILQLTNSPSLVGAIAAVRFTGMGLAPLGGALADRFNRRNILFILQCGGMVYASILMLLYYTGWLQVWHVFAVALFSGVVRGFDHTTRQTIIPDLTEGRYLTSATGLIMVSQGLTAVIGALASGYLFEIAGAGGCFAVMTTAFLFAGVALLPIQPGGEKRIAAKQSVWQSTAEGARYITRDRGLSALILLAAIANLCAFPCTIGIMAVFARDVLHIGADGLGLIMAAEGLGGLVGALFLSSLGGFRHKGWLLVGVALAWPGLLAAFSFFRAMPVALTVIAIAGIARGMDMALIQLLLFAWSEAGLRGRVMGVRMFVIITLMFGNFLSGLGAAEWGSANVMLVNASAGILTTLATIFWAPHLYRRPEQIKILASKEAARV